MGEAAGLGGGVEDLELVPVHALPRVQQCHHSAATAALGLAMRGEEAFGFERRHAAMAGGGHRLAVDVVGDVAGGEHARHRGRGRVRRGLDVARRLHLDLAGEQFGRRRMADGDEHAVGRASRSARRS